MKKLFSLLIVFISIKCFGQVYQVLPQYGYEMKRVNATLVLLAPSDTVTNKTGIARIGTVLYSGNGTKWTAATSTDTTSLSNRINLKVNISDTAAMLSNYAKTSAVALKVNISDTAAMLANYAKTSAVNSAVALKVNISDTAAMLTPYLRKIDTASLSNRINLKANINNATFTGTFATAAGAIGNASLANGAVANLSGTNTGDQNLQSVTNLGATTTNSITASSLIKSGGTASQILAADGSVITAGNFITITGGQISSTSGASGGGSSVNYYLNGGTNQGTFGGSTYYEFSKTAVIGTGADFNIAADGYIASFITDAADPSLLKIPAGNWNLEFYFNSSSAGGSPSFYVELYKYDGTTFTSIASSSATPEGITNGTTIDAYYTSLAVPETVLDINDRLAIRVYVNHSSKTITLHTQNGHLCEVITTFTTGLTALNGLQAQVQNFATGTSGTDFAISSTGSTHTFNLPDASAANRGVITTGTQTIAGAKTFSSNVTASITGNAGTATALQTARTIGTTTGDATSAGSTFDGTANNTNALTLATVNTNVGSFGSATQSPTYTVNGKGLLTAAANVTITPAVGSISGLGTGVATALGVNTGSAGAVVLFNGNAGTPSALVGTNITGTASLNINGTVGATTATTGAFTTATASTSLRTPLLIGGTTTTSPLTYQPTSGVGTTGADHIFKVGNNGATEAMRILNNGNLGIGTSTPTTSLEIGNGTGTKQLYINSSNNMVLGVSGGSVLGFPSGDITLMFTTSNKPLGITNQSANPLIFGTNALERMRIDANGNLGINTTSPAASALLDLTSTTKGFLLPRMTTTERNAIASPATGLSIYNTTLNTNDTYDGTQWQRFGASTSITGTAAISTSLTTPLLIGGTATTSPLTYKTTTGVGTTGADHIFKVGNNGATEAMRILNNADIGIGTSSPTAKLHLFNAATTYLDVESSAASGIVRLKGGGYNGIFSEILGVNQWGIGGGGTSKTMLFYTDNTERMRISSGGNVGIGNTSPAYKLDVSGVIYGLNQIVANSTITDPTTNNTLSNGTVFSLNGVTTNNNFGMGLGAIRNSKYDIWFQTGSSNGGGYRWYIGTSEKMTMDANGSVAIGTTTPAASALLDVTSTTKGLLFPRMTTTQKNAITGPSAGLVVYDTTLNKLCVFTTVWETITSL